MRHRKPLRSGLASVIGRYVELKQALGRGFENERAVLEYLDAFLVKNRIDDLTGESFARWCATMYHLTSGVRRYRMRIVRNLCLYRRRTEPNCFVPDRTLFPFPHQHVRPYIFSESEVARLISVTSSLLVRPVNHLRQEAARLAVVLLYTTGLRTSELLRMTVADYDPGARTLLVRASKFHKSRYVPLSASGWREVERYLRARRARRGPTWPDAPLLWYGSSAVRSYTESGLWRLFSTLHHMAGIRKPNGCTPRVHDLRHSFAVNGLLRWYRSGVDVQAKLPLLATYMGHVSIASTLWYLPFVEPLARCASARFAQRYGSAITSLPGRSP